MRTKQAPISEASLEPQSRSDLATPTTFDPPQLGARLLQLSLHIIEGSGAHGILEVGLQLSDLVFEGGNLQGVGSAWGASPS